MGHLDNLAVCDVVVMADEHFKSGQEPYLRSLGTHGVIGAVRNYIHSVKDLRTRQIVDLHAMRFTFCSNASLESKGSSTMLSDRILG